MTSILEYPEDMDEIYQSQRLNFCNTYEQTTGCLLQSRASAVAITGCL